MFYFVDTLSHASTLLPPTAEKTISELPSSAEEMHPSVDKVPYHELQKIEQIKSELQKIEQNFIASSNSDPDSMLNVLHSVTTPELSTMKDQPLLKWSSKVEPMKTPEKVEIDDIEIKAEDVYAFSDIDIEIPPVSSIHKTPMGRQISEKNLFNKRDLTPNSAGVDEVAAIGQENMEDLQIGATTDNAGNSSEAVHVSSDNESSKVTDAKRTENISQVDSENIERFIFDYVFVLVLIMHVDYFIRCVKF